MNVDPAPVRACALVICGVPASGKSTLAAAAAARLGWRVVCSDLVRKELAGVAATAHAGLDHYTAEFSRRVYAELAARASACVRERGGVIVDGTFRRRAGRDAFRSGFAPVPVLYAECRAGLPVLLARAAARDRSPGRVSDATVNVVAREHGNWEPLDEVPPGNRIVISAGRPLAVSVSELAALARCRSRP